MTTWPDSSGEVFRRYVQGLGLQTAMAARVYHCILRRFQRFISDYHPASPVSEASLTAWIQDRITVWPLHLVIHRARLVDRFLDWLLSGNHIAENPLAKLRAEYRQHSTAPIVRALADPNPVAALEKLRTLPPFGSHLGPAMRAHISVMRTAGFRYADYENRFLGLDRFLQQQPDAAEQPLAVLVQRWAQDASRLRTAPGAGPGRPSSGAGSPARRSIGDHAPTGPPTRAGGTPQTAATAHIQHGGDPEAVSDRARISIPSCFPPPPQSAYDAGSGILRRVAPGRDCETQDRRRSARPGSDRDPGNEILQDPAPPALTERPYGPSGLHGRAEEGRWPFRQQLDSALASAGSLRILADYGGEFAGSCVASRRPKTTSSQRPHRPTHSRPSPHIRGSPNDRMVSGRRQPRAHAPIPGHLSWP